MVLIVLRMIRRRLTTTGSRAVLSTMSWKNSPVHLPALLEYSVSQTPPGPIASVTGGGRYHRPRPDWPRWSVWNVTAQATSQGSDGRDVVPTGREPTGYM